MHAKLLCWMDWQPIEWKGCAKHVEPWHKKHMKYNAMSKGMINQDKKHRWYLGLILTFAPIAMLDLGWKLALTTSV
jgi:hypothetical protein